MEDKEYGKGMRRGLGYLSNALKVTLGAGAALGGAYLLSRVSEKQDTEASFSRLEQMLAELTPAPEEPEKPAGKRKR